MSCFCHTAISPRKQVRTTTETIKVLKVIGEAVGQVVAEGTFPIHAVKIDKICSEIVDITDFVFKNKVVKQGTIHTQVFYVDPCGFVKETCFDIPFTLAVDIPCIEKTPFTEVQNHLLDIDTDFILNPACHGEPGKLHLKVVAHILVKVSEWAQIDVVTKVDVFPKVNSMNRIVCC